jgi:hypothetical protein
VHLIGEDTRETDLPAVAVEADDARGVPHCAGDVLARAAARPIRLVAEVLVDRVYVDALPIVVELEAVAEDAPHGGYSTGRHR